MKTIEERADAYVGHSYEVDEDLSITMTRNAYIQGAEEQRKIDIEKAWQWIENTIFPTSINCIYVWEDMFRKAMEE